jgi:uncharacterized protein with ParB-like and HNH nuclease domain
MGEKDNNSTFKTRAIKTLDGLHFSVKKYQRGYKWGVNEVYDLLNDIASFKQVNNSFYCLQPLVVCSDAENNSYELIDGQQRLTTTHIILMHLKQNLYSLSYETRKARKGFLDDITQVPLYKSLEFQNSEQVNFESLKQLEKEINQEWQNYVEQKPIEINNIDNYHFFTAYQTIHNWLFKFPDKKTELQHNLIHNTHIIWYAIESEQTPEQVFINFNQGKIHLQQAELIKALFVLSWSKEPNIELRGFKTNQLAEEWNTIENKLQDENFWFFISNDTSDTKKANRIDFLFDIIAGKSKKEQNKLFAYHYYLNLYNNGLLTSKFWKKVKDLFLLLEEWYNNREIYHLLGLIIFLNIKNISEIQEYYKGLKDKHDFVKLLKSLVNKKLDLNNNESKYNLNNLNYKGTSYSYTLNLLVVYNVALYQSSSSNYIFPFNKLKTQQWSLEHIHAQNSEEFTTATEVISWLNDIKTLLIVIKEESNDIDFINNIIKSINTLNGLCDEHTEINKDMKLKLKGINEQLESIVDVHGIKNLCLLDRGTNSSIGNKNFQDKRGLILNFERNNTLPSSNGFIPMGTKHVFLKYDTKDVNEINFSYWSNKDRDAYQTAITYNIEKLLSN